MIRPPSPDPFELFFREHHARLCEFVHGYVRSEEVSRDIVQDLFLALWEKNGTSEAPDLTKAYLYAAARNRARKYIRHRRVVGRFEQRCAAWSEEAPGRADDAVHYRETMEAVEAAIGALPDRCREVFLLSRRQHMSYAEIAGALGLSIKTVEVQMWRALRKLRESLAAHLTTVVLLASGRWFPPGI
jgi:RNA polymerase sigma-70 factor, ECF subfamily